MTLNTDNFTGDVMTLLAVQGKDKAREVLLQADAETLHDFIRDGIIASLYPYMEDVPGFVKQVVARALLEHVDWKHVADWIRSEDN